MMISLIDDDALALDFLKFMMSFKAAFFDPKQFECHVNNFFLYDEIN